MEKRSIAVPCGLNPLQITIIAVDVNCSREAYHALQSKCVKPESMEFDFGKLEEFMKFFHDEKIDRETGLWKMKNVREWDEALEEVYAKLFQ